jgi:hypothetical protein
MNRYLNTLLFFYIKKLKKIAQEGNSKNDKKFTLILYFPFQK